MHNSQLAELAAAARAALTGRLYPDDLLARLDALDEAALNADPWLMLFQGRRLCRVHSRFSEATLLIDTALEQLRHTGDTDGELWALAEWVVVRYHGREFSRGLAEVDRQIHRPMAHFLRAELHFGRLLCLIGLGRLAEAASAGEAALAELDDEPDLWLQLRGRIQVLRNIAAAYHYLGQVRRAVAAAEQAAELAQSHPDTADARPWCFYELGLAYWRQGQFARATETLDTARRLAEAWHHRELWRWAVATQGHVLRDQNRLDAALAAYQLAGSWGEEAEGPAFIQLRQSRLAEARWSCETRLKLARIDGGAVSIADSQMLLALVELSSNRVAEALALLDAAGEAYAAAGSWYYHATAELYRAAAGLLLGRYDIASAGLTAYLSFARREEVLTCIWWNPDLVEMLLLHALREGIEPAWASHLLEVRFAGKRISGWQVLSSDEPTELMIARRVQLSLLPEAPPMMPDLELASCLLPAAEVGGDFIGFFPQGTDPESGARRQMGLALGDISGKGLGAALLLSGAVVALNIVATSLSTPAEVAEALHAAMRPYTSRSRMNIAFCYTLLSQDGDGWALRAVGAGAVPPLVCRAGERAVWLETTGFPLGTFAAGGYREVQTHLAPGDRLVLMSDGVIEMMGPSREVFGFDRLARVVEEAGDGLEASVLMEVILEQIRTFGGEELQHDDITLIVVRVLAGEGK